MSITGNAEDYSATQLIALLIGIILIFLLLITSIYDVTVKCRKYGQNKKNSNNSTDDTTKDLRILIYLNLISTLGHMTNNFIRLTITNNGILCILFAKTGPVVFHIMRCSMYLIFIRRIQVIYNETLFKLSKIHIFILYGIVALYFFPFVGYIDWSIAKPIYHEHFGCLPEFQSKLAVGIAFLIDVLLSIYCLFQFIYPISRLLSKQQDKSINFELYQTITKYSILGIIAILSSFISWIAVLTTVWGTYYLIIDDFLNGIIVLLIHPIHDNHYKRLCFMCNIFCICCCNVPKEQTNRTLRVLSITSSGGINESRENKLRTTASMEENRNKLQIATSTTTGSATPITPIPSPTPTPILVELHTNIKNKDEDIKNNENKVEDKQKKDINIIYVEPDMNEKRLDDLMEIAENMMKAQQSYDDSYNIEESTHL